MNCAEVLAISHRTFAGYRHSLPVVLCRTRRLGFGDWLRRRFARAVANLRHLWIRLGDHKRGEELERLAFSRDEQLSIVKDISSEPTEPQCNAS